MPQQSYDPDKRRRLANALAQGRPRATPGAPPATTPPPPVSIDPGFSRRDQPRTPHGAPLGNFTPKAHLNSPAAPKSLAQLSKPGKGGPSVGNHDISKGLSYNETHRHGKLIQAFKDKLDPRNRNQARSNIPENVRPTKPKRKGPRDRNVSASPISGYPR